MKEWRTERTGWRDEELSLRHGCWGFNCPAVDLDFVMMEYNHGKPCALVEYKHRNARAADPGHATYRALVDLANNYSPGALPCFIARYDPEDWSFVVTPLNEKAQAHYSHCENERLTEQRFVRSLILLRKAVLSRADEEAIEQLNGTLKRSEYQLTLIDSG
ncbi:MAG: hypothetical protein K0U84_13490 [Actinomycetia bacterium]|nr:hypothetical protein [Actinomycetes bacterium]